MSFTISSKNKKIVTKGVYLLGEKIKYLDAFSGVGGFRIAFEEYTNSECVLSIEYDKKAQASHSVLWGEDKLWKDDIRKLNYSELPDFDVLVGGFPCAKFSAAGDRTGFASCDPRAQMFWELANILEAKKPPFFLFENVKGLLNHDEGRSFKAIINKVDELGYNVEWQLLNAKDFGYPVLRERVFIIGHLRGIGSKPILPITEGIGSYGETPPIFQFRRGYFRVFQGYCPTLTASMGTGGNNVPFVIQENKLRKLMPLELFRLQGFPEKYAQKLAQSGLANSTLYERAGRTVFIPIVKLLVEGIEKEFLRINTKEED